MGKNSDEEHSLPPRSDGAAADTARNNQGGNRCSGCCCSARISRCFSLRCVLILAFSAAVFLSAVFWLPPFLGLPDPRDLDLDPRFKGIKNNRTPFSLSREILWYRSRVSDSHWNR